MPDKIYKKTTDKMSEIDEHIQKRFDIRRRLGKGAYGIVWKAVDRKTKRVVAIKKIFDAFRNQIDSQRTFREIMFLQAFSNHPNVIKLYSIHRAGNNRDIYLGFEYMETDLHNVIKRQHLLKDIHMRYIMYQLFKAIKYIHSGNVIHRDLKPSNILLNSACHCKIADFGLARSLSSTTDNPNSDPRLTDYVATRWYRAPEILIANTRYTKGIDMWSLGCIFGEMLAGKPLFPGSSTVNQVEKILSMLPSPTADDINSITSGFGSSLLKNPPSVPKKLLSDILKDVPNDAMDLISKLLILNPNKRFTASECLEHTYVTKFHNPDNEPSLNIDIVPPLSDDVQLSIDDYRNKLYELMTERPATTPLKSQTPQILEQISRSPSPKVVTTTITTPVQSNLYSCHRVSTPNKTTPQKTRSVNSLNNTPNRINNSNNAQQRPNRSTNSSCIKTVESSPNIIRQHSLTGTSSSCANKTNKLSKTLIKSSHIQKERPLIINSKSFKIVNNNTTNMVVTNKSTTPIQNVHSAETIKVFLEKQQNNTIRKNIINNEPTNNYYSKITNNKNNNQQTVMGCFGDNTKNMTKIYKRTNSQSSIILKRNSSNEDMNNISTFDIYKQNHGIISSNTFIDIKSTIR